jgi:putative N6-adenine-specific DNA methylase
VNSTPSTFFVVVPPGLEELALWEIRQTLNLFKHESASAIPHVGGWEIVLPTSIGFLLNHYLKIPTRILLRLTSFKAKDFPKLYEKTRKLPWHDFLRDGPVDVVVSTYQSKLLLKDRLAQTVRDAIRDADAHQKFRKEFLKVPQTVFIRMENDQCLLSLDTSGEALYKRGIKTRTVEAPIRETLASALVRQIEKSDLIQGKCEVFDPVCGSGTLLYAFDEIYFPNKMRPMAYQNFPSAAKITSSHKWLVNEPKWQTLNMLGSDISEKAVDAAKFNLQAWKENGGSDFEIRTKDLIEVTLPMEKRKGVSRVVLMNPPYGQRISGHATNILVTRALEIFEPDVLGIIAPPGGTPKILPAPYRWFQKPIATFNGGLEIEIRLARRA